MTLQVPNDVTMTFAVLLIGSGSVRPTSTLRVASEVIASMSPFCTLEHSRISGSPPSVHASSSADVISASVTVMPVVPSVTPATADDAYDGVVPVVFSAGYTVLPAMVAPWPQIQASTPPVARAVAVAPAEEPCLPRQVNSMSRFSSFLAFIMARPIGFCPTVLTPSVYVSDSMIVLELICG